MEHLIAREILFVVGLVAEDQLGDPGAVYSLHLDFREAGVFLESLERAEPSEALGEKTPIRPPSLCKFLINLMLFLQFKSI